MRQSWEMCLAVPSAAAPPRHAVIPFSNPPPPQKKGRRREQGCHLGKEAQMCPGQEDLGAGSRSSILQTPTSPCKHTASVRRPVLSRSNLGRKDTGGRGGYGGGDYPPDYLSCYLCSSPIPRMQPPICTYSQPQTVHPSPVILP